MPVRVELESCPDLGLDQRDPGMDWQSSFEHPQREHAIGLVFGDLDERGELLATRRTVHLSHARKVAEVAHWLFDSLQSLHQLPPAQGKLLEAAAYLHDIGHFVSDSSHHKHSGYLVAHSDMPGFTGRERQMIALLCRYHRKSMPTARHSSFQTFDADSRRAITLLTPLLRIADSLDRSHEQRIAGLQVQLKNGSVTIALESSANPDLELWAVERIADAFRETYQMQLTLTRVKS